MKVRTLIALAILALLVWDAPHLGIATRGLAQITADSPVTSALPSRELAGFEIELNAGALENIVPVFDWARIDQESGARIRELDLIPRLAIRSYLADNPENFHSLPPELRSQLTAGLGPIFPESRLELANPRPLEVISRPIVSGRTSEPAPAPPLPERPTGGVAAPTLPDGYVRDRSGLILPEGARAGLEELRIREAHQRSDDEARANWQTVLDRWTVLAEAGNAPVRLERLPRGALAEVILMKNARDAADYRNRSRTIAFPTPLRPDLPAATRTLFDGLDWHITLLSLEFRLSVPHPSVPHVLQRARSFARLANVERELFRPDEVGHAVNRTNANQGASLHLHYSREGPAFIEQARLLNLLLLAEGSPRVGKGILTQAFGFRDLFHGGLVRVYPPGNHFEIRYDAGRDPTEWLQLFRQELDQPGAIAERLTTALQHPAALEVIGEAIDRRMELPILDALLALDRQRPGWVAQNTGLMDAFRTRAHTLSHATHRFLLSLHALPVDLEAQALQEFRNNVRITSSAAAHWGGVRHPEVRRVVHAALAGQRPSTLESFVIALPLNPDEVDLAIVRTYVQNCRGGGTETSRTGRIISEFVRRARSPADLELVINRLPEWPDSIRTSVTEKLVTDTPFLTTTLRERIRLLAQTDVAVAAGIIIGNCPTLSHVVNSL